MISFNSSTSVKMFQKKCMVVGSLLVMAAQTATATSTCSGMTGLKATICGQNGYSGEYVDNPGDVNCAGDTCNNNDAITCCKPAALCTTITDVSDPFALSEVCSDNAVYAQAVTVGAFCAGTACALSDESGCCVVKANCDTITLGTSPSLTAVCGDDDAFTGTLIAGAKCAGATCALVDKETCCVQKALCGTITADSSPNLPTVCGNDPGYTGALGSSSAKCAGATCDATDRATCCAAATPADDDGDDDDDDDDDDTPAATCSVTDGSKASPWTGGTAGYEECTCTGAAKKCSTLNVCDVAKKTCVCTPGKDHWCYEDAEHSFAVKFICMADGSDKGSEFKGWKCVGDNVLEAKYSDAACTTHITPANGGDDKTFSATKVTKVEKDDGTVKTTEDPTITGISTCKGGVAGAGAAEAKPAVPPQKTCPKDSINGASSALMFDKACCMSVKCGEEMTSLKSCADLQAILSKGGCFGECLGALKEDYRAGYFALPGADGKPVCNEEEAKAAQKAAEASLNSAANTATIGLASIAILAVVTAVC
jgi:hypothetical protein